MIKVTCRVNYKACIKDSKRIYNLFIIIIFYNIRSYLNYNVEQSKRLFYIEEHEETTGEADMSDRSPKYLIIPNPDAWSWSEMKRYLKNVVPQS